MKFILCKNQKNCYKIQLKYLQKGYNWGFYNRPIEEQLLLFQEQEYPLYIIIGFEQGNEKRLYWGEIDEIKKDPIFNKHLRKQKLKKLIKNEYKSKTSIPNT